MSDSEPNIPESVRVVDDRLIKVTEAAIQKLSALKERENAGNYLRVRVTGGGCSGLAYKLGFVEAPKSGDLMLPGEDKLYLVTSTLEARHGAPPSMLITTTSTSEKLPVIVYWDMVQFFCYRILYWYKVRN